MDRCGVVFRLGQVVQHRDERWRGIVVEWDNLDKPVDTERPGGACSVQTVSDEFSKSTTPTTKKYTWTGIEDNSETTLVRYTLLLDEGDADALKSQLKEGRLDVYVAGGRYGIPWMKNMSSNRTITAEVKQLKKQQQEQTKGRYTTT